MRGLYIHIPFCQKKCRYCGFYSVEEAGDSLVRSYFDACLKDLTDAENKKFDTIYVGGGTPSSVPAYLLEPFLENVLTTIDFSGKEFTLEVNPESVNTQLACLITELPISRISMGVQSLNDDVLKLLGRVHTAERALDAYDILRNIPTAPDVNLDLIFDIPTVPDDIIKHSLEGIASMEPEHISAYSYSPDTGFLPDVTEDESGYLHVKNYLQKKGFYKYEISNFAIPGHESKHNMLYWQMHEYVGIGASAHSMLQTKQERRRYSRPADVHKYIKNPLNKELDESVIADDMMAESVLFGLRITDGISLEELESRFFPVPESLKNNITTLITRGLLQWTGNKLHTTEKGELLLDSVMSFLWPDS